MLKVQNSWVFFFFISLEDVLTIPIQKYLCRTQISERLNIQLNVFQKAAQEDNVVFYGLI